MHGKTNSSKIRQVFATNVWLLSITMTHYDQLLDVALTNGHARTGFTEGLSKESHLIFGFLRILKSCSALTRER